MMTDSEKFAELCRADLCLHGADGDGIGTYNEKRIHRVLKRLITENAECYEVRLGRYFADVLTDDGIFEIQTGSFRSLRDKVKYYLKNTECNIYIVRPMICEKMLIRADKETGEIIKTSRSTKKGKLTDILSELFHLCESIPNNRVFICMLHINAEEYRYSEAQRYRKAGKYDCDLRPTELVDLTVLSSLSDFCGLLPNELLDGEFTAADFERSTRLRGRNRYYALTALCSMEIITKRTDGRRHFYRVTKFNETLRS